MFCGAIYSPEADLINHELDRLYKKVLFMNEFLLFAFIIIYLVIRHGKPVTGDRSGRPKGGNRESSHPGGEQWE